METPAFTIQARIDIRKLARLHKLLCDRGYFITTKSGLLNKAIDLLFQMSEASPDLTIQESMEYLEGRGISYGSRKPNKGLFVAQMEEDARKRVSTVDSILNSIDFNGIEEEEGGMPGSNT